MVELRAKHRNDIKNSGDTAGNFIVNYLIKSYYFFIPMIMASIYVFLIITDCNMNIHEDTDTLGIYTSSCYRVNKNALMLKEKNLIYNL